MNRRTDRSTVCSDVVAAAVVAAWRPPPVVHGAPAASPVKASATPSSKSSVSSSVSCGGSTCTATLSNVPRELSEPTPTKPLLSAEARPSMIRGANVWVNATVPSAGR